MNGEINLNKIKVFSGLSYDIGTNIKPVENEIICLKGKNYKIDNEKVKGMKEIKVSYNNSMLSKHILILGGIGTGKTNCFLTILDKIHKNKTSTDNIIIFDTKGDFYNKFGSSKLKSDFVIGNSVVKDKKGSVKNVSEDEIWNIFDEIDDDKIEESSNEIASMIFSDLKKNSQNSFFPLSAQQIFAAVLRAIKRTPTHFYEKPSNKLLKEFFNGVNIYNNGDDSDNREVKGVLNNIVSLLITDPKEIGILSYLSSKFLTYANSFNMPDSFENEFDNNTQIQGIIAEIRLVIDQLFIGNFAKKGNFSITKAIREKKGKSIYIEYDITQGNTISPIYSLLFDLAIKESLNIDNRNNNRNNYFLIDEFKLLPNLKHLDDAVNFGRDIGVKFMIGMQNISQIINNYGKDNAMNILSGFSNIISFKVSDYPTRRFLIELFGENMKIFRFLSKIPNRGLVESLEKGNVVDDKDILSLKVGECIIKLVDDQDVDVNNPFFLKMDEFEK